MGKVDIQKGETERIFRLMIHSPSEHNSQCYSDLKPGASSGSPMWVQGPKALGRPGLLSQATGGELEAGLPGPEPAPIWDPRRAKRGPYPLRHRAGPSKPFS